MDLALNNLYRLICHQTKPNQTTVLFKEHSLTTITTTTVLVMVLLLLLLLLSFKRHLSCNYYFCPFQGTFLTGTTTAFLRNLLLPSQLLLPFSEQLNSRHPLMITMTDKQITSRRSPGRFLRPTTNQTTRFSSQSTTRMSIITWTLTQTIIGKMGTTSFLIIHSLVLSGNK